MFKRLKSYSCKDLERLLEILKTGFYEFEEPKLQSL